MSHEITIREDGTAETFSGNNIVPWHSLGSVVKGTVTAKEAIQLAHLDWRVRKEPIFIQTESGLSEFEDYKAVVREDNGVKLGVVGNRYTPVQNEEAFEFFDSVISEGQAVYETAGSLREGRKIWIMAKLPETMYIDPSDKMDKWILMISSHDGTHSVWMQNVAVRVVCQNTLNAALKGAKNQVKMRHTKSFKSHKEEVQRALGIAYGYFGRLELVLKMLKDQKCNEEEVVRYNETLFPGKLNKETGLYECSSRTENIREQVTELFQRGTGNVGETRYDYLNSITEFVDQKRSTRAEEGANRQEAKFESALLGTGANLKQRATDLLLQDLTLPKN